MTGPNIPNGGAPEKKEKEPKQSNKNILDTLIHSGIQAHLGDAPMNPGSYQDYERNKKKHLEHIRDEIRGLWRSEEEYRDISDDDLTIASVDEELAPRVLKYAYPTLIEIARLEKRALDLYPEIRGEDNWQQILKNAIDYLEYDEIGKYNTIRGKLKGWIYKLFPRLIDTSKEERVKYDDIFYDRDAYISTDLERKRIQNIVRDHERYDKVMDADDIGFLLSLYDRAPHARLKELFSHLGIMFSVKFAKKNSLIREDQIHELALMTYGSALTDLPEEKQALFINRIANTDIPFLSLTEIDETKLPGLLESPITRQALIREIKNNLEIPQKEVKPGISSYSGFLKSIESKTQLSNSDELKTPGATIKFTDSDGQIQYLRIDRTEVDGEPPEIGPDKDYGVEMTFFSVKDNTIRSGEQIGLSYTDFEKFLTSLSGAMVLSREAFEDKELSKDVEKANAGNAIYDGREAEKEPINEGNIEQKVNALDPEGAKYGFGPGTAFLFPSMDEDGKSNKEEIWTIRSIGPGDRISLIDEQGNDSNTRNMLIASVFRIFADTSGFRRIGKIADDAGMKEALYDYGIGADDELKDGKWYRKIKDHEGHKKERELTCFIKDDGEHIRMGEMKYGQVIFGEFEGGDKGGDIENIKSGKEKPKYKWQQMSYAKFLVYLEKHKFKASENDILYPEAEHYHDHSHPHLHGSLTKRLLQWQNPASIWKGFEMVWHGIEHTLEKGAKLDAARFALKVSKFIPGGGDIDAQVYADVVEGSKEIIEKYEKKIFGLPGPRGRKKALHIAEVTDSRPEEVIAAINFLLKSYGHLYAEDIKHKQSFIYSREHCVGAKQGAFVFFDALVMTSKMGNLSYWRGKAYDRALTELGSEKEHEGQPTEEQLIHALTKIVDGNWEEFPYAATIVKAIGGPSSFEANFKDEGFTKMKDKGYKQTQMLNAQGRLNKAIGYADTRELKKLVGSMQAVAEKIKSPRYQAIPFIWCVGGLSSYIDSDTLQKVKSYGENGYSFHAYAFMRNREMNDTYADTVRIALKDIDKSGGLLKEFDSIRKQLDPDPENEDKTKGAAKKMMEFWQAHEKKLHPMLQGHNGWITKKYREGDTTIRKYANTLTDQHSQQLDSETVPGHEYGTDWHSEGGLAMNGIYKINTNTGLHTMDRTLRKMRLAGTRSGDKQMSKDVERKLWARVVDQMNDIREGDGGFAGDKALQKTQFLAYRREIMDYFRKELQVTTADFSEQKINEIINLPHIYWRDLEGMGINPRSIFHPDFDELNAEGDYSRWIRGDRFGAPIQGGNKTWSQLQQGIQEKANNAQGLSGIHAVRQNRGAEGYTDSDAQYRGGSADTTVGGGEN